MVASARRRATEFFGVSCVWSSGNCRCRGAGGAVFLTRPHTYGSKRIHFDEGRWRSLAVCVVWGRVNFEVRLGLILDKNADAVFVYGNGFSFVKVLAGKLIGAGEGGNKSCCFKFMLNGNYRFG